MFLVDKGKSAVHRVKTALFKKSGRWDKHPLNVTPPKTDWQELDRQLVALSSSLPFVIRDFHVDPAKYADYRQKFWPGSLYAIGYKDKKIMEHFVSYTLLGVSKADKYIDVASENSPFPDLYRRIIGAETYSQDLSYPPGVSGYRIGSSADSMPIEAASVDKMSLHCAFEHFQNDVDTNFVREVSRTLRPGGKCVIVPLYMASRLLNIVDPILDASSVRFDDGAVVMGETNLGGLFERYYSPESLKRILIPGLGLVYEIYRVHVPESISAGASPALARVNYALCITRQPSA
jgi:hypothetical protein